MNMRIVLHKLRFLPIFALPLAATWLSFSAVNGASTHPAPEKINLALRRTADALLRLSGDSLSRIPAVEQSGGGIWSLRLEKPFSYEGLPALLQESFDLYGIDKPYHVAIRRCEDSVIDLGYHQLDLDAQGSVPCGGRDLPEGCRYIEINFSEEKGSTPLWLKIGVLMLLTAGVGYLIWRRRPPAMPESADAGKWIVFGNSRLDLAAQVLICNGVRQELTFREAKLLRLFAQHPDRLLERQFILQEVWADEGVLVGRSLDMFVSRLRKKLAPDPSVGIAAVHGVGYRLEADNKES